MDKLENLGKSGNFRKNSIIGKNKEHRKIVKFHKKGTRKIFKK